jgi:hypothetical protein
LPTKTIYFHRNYNTDRDKQGGRAKFSPAALPTGLPTGLSRQLRAVVRVTNRQGPAPGKLKTKQEHASVMPAPARRCLIKG